jgi:hypothetical protein
MTSHASARTALLPDAVAEKVMQTGGGDRMAAIEPQQAPCRYGHGS